MPPTLQQERQAVTSPGSEYDYLQEQYVETPEPLPLGFEQMIERENMAFATVRQILSGETYELDNDYRITLLGVNSPDPTLIPEEGASYSQQAIEYASGILRGKPVQLKFETMPDLTRAALPCYLYLADGRLLNEEMLLEGLGSFDADAEIGRAHV